MKAGNRTELKKLSVYQADTPDCEPEEYQVCSIGPIDFVDGDFGVSDFFGDSVCIRCKDATRKYRFDNRYYRTDTVDGFLELYSALRTYIIDTAR